MNCYQPFDENHHVTETPHAEQPGEKESIVRPKISGLCRPKHPRSIARDAKYVCNLRDLLLLLGKARPIPPLVSSGVCEDLYVSFIAPQTARPWYLEPTWMIEPIGLRKHHVPPTAEERTERLVSMYWHLALVEVGPAYAFSLNLRHDVEEEIRRHPRGPVHCLYHRLVCSLQTHLNRPVEFYVGGEEAEGRLHLHGEVGLNRSELKVAKVAMRQAAGEWSEESRSKQCKIEPADANWSGYVCGTYRTPGKRAKAARKRIGLTLGPAFNGQLMACTRQLKARGASLYREHRKFVLEHKSMLTGRTTFVRVA